MLFRILSFVIIFTIFPFVNKAHAVSDRCPRHAVKTDLKSKKDKTRFLSGSLGSINEYLKSHSVLAFVQNPISIRTYYKFSAKNIGKGRYCVVLDDVIVHYRSSPSIVMPSGIKKSSCEYKIIRKHEQRHLDVHYKYYNKSVKEYKSFLGRVARRVPVFKAVTSKSEAEQVRNEIMKYFDETFYKKVASSIKEMHGLQKKIDSSQEYTFTNRKINRCSKLAKENNRPNKKAFYD